MKVLVTGASGFCGSAVCIKLAEAGHEVYANYRNSSKFTDLLMDFERIKHLRMPIEGVPLHSDSFDAIIHTAASSPPVTVTRLANDNVEMTKLLIGMAKVWGVQKFIFYSSLSVHGEISQPVVNEDTPIVNPDAYGLTKYLCEMMLSESSIPSLMLRLPGIVGPNSHRNWQSSLAPKILNRETINIYHGDSLFNNSIHVDTLSEFVVNLLDREWEDSETLVLGSIGGITIEEVVRRLAKGLGKTADIRHKISFEESFTLSSVSAISYWGYKPMEIGALVDRYAKDVLETMK
jgi:nucleoside-diphosphate-sugar epimerase